MDPAPSFGRFERLATSVSLVCLACYLATGIFTWSWRLPGAWTPPGYERWLQWSNGALCFWSLDEGEVHPATSEGLVGGAPGGVGACEIGPGALEFVAAADGVADADF